MDGKREERGKSVESFVRGKREKISRRGRLRAQRGDGEGKRFKIIVKRRKREEGGFLMVRLSVVCP